MLWTLFVVASWPFWLLLIIWIIAESVAIHKDNGPAAFIILAAFLLALTLFTDAQLGWFKWIGLNFELVLAAVIAYVILGCGWSPFYFIVFYRLRKEEEFEENRDRLFKEFRADPKRYDQRLRDHVRCATFKEYAALCGYPPHIRDNKASFIFWAAWWPFSIIDTLFFDLFYRMYEWVYYRVGEWCQQKIEKAFNARFGNLDDTTTPTKPTPTL